MDIFRERLLQPWTEWPVVVVDFETTGPDPATCQPVEIALARFERGEPVLSWSTLLNPGCPIPEAASAIHGIYDADVAGAPTIYEALALAPRDTLGGDAVPCAYSAQFDRAIMHRLFDDRAPCHSVALLDTELPWLDPLVVVRHVDRFVRGTGRHKLSMTCARHGVVQEHAHRALGDALATGKLLYSPKISAALGDMTIGEVLRRQQIHAEAQERSFNEWKAKQPPQQEQSNA